MPAQSKRDGYISWEEFFMLTAIVASHRSKDPHTQVGACLADVDNRILSVGYNGATAGYDDDEFPWGTSDDYTKDKHAFVCHAEANAILNFRGSLKDLRGATVYVTLFPCNECAKLLAQVGIGKVIYLSDKYDGTDGNVVAKDILAHAGVQCEQMFLDKHVDLIDITAMTEALFADMPDTEQETEGCC